MPSQNPIDATILSTEGLNQRSNTVLSTAIAPTGPKSLLFIDAGVADAGTLAASAAPGTEVVFLTSQEDAIAQITRTLLGREGIDSLQIISHGRNGSLDFASGALNLASLPSQVNQLKSWSAALSANADILLYGCDVAQNAMGKAFVSLLAQTTGADVAASSDVTGFGGNWDLEFQTGRIETAAVRAIDYAKALGTYTVNSTAASGAGSLAQALSDARNLDANPDTINFNFATNSTITLSSVISLGATDNIKFVRQAGSAGTVTLQNSVSSAAGDVFNVNTGAIAEFDGLTISATGNGAFAIYNTGGTINRIANSSLTSTSYAYLGSSGTLALVDNCTISSTLTSGNIFASTGTTGVIRNSHFSGTSTGSLISIGNATAILNSSVIQSGSGSAIQVSGTVGQITNTAINAGTTGTALNLASGSIGGIFNSTIVFADGKFSTGTGATIAKLYNTAILKSTGTGTTAVTATASGNNYNNTFANSGLSAWAQNPSGKRTFGYAIAAGTSPLVNAGTNAQIPADVGDLNGNNNTTEATPQDQRGQTRVIGSAVDIGAFEFQTVVVANSAPVINNGAGNIAYTEGGAVTAIVPATVTVTDADNPANLNSGQLVVKVTAGSNQKDQLTIAATNGVTLNGSNVLVNGTTIGTFTGGTNSTDLVVTLNASSTPTLVTALLKTIGYSNTATNIKITGETRTLSITVSDGQGGNSTILSKTVNLTGVNTAPTDVIFTPNPNGVLENTPGIVVGTLSATDLDGDTLTYEITGGDPDGLFEVVGNQIKVKSDKFLDYETLTAGKLTLSVIAKDATTSSTAIDAVISVTDTLERPTFVMPATIMAKANRTITPVIVTGFTQGMGDSGQTLVGYNVTVVSGGDLIKAGTTPTIDNLGKLTLVTSASATPGDIVLSVTATDSGASFNTSEAQTLTIKVGGKLEQRETILRNEAAGAVVMQFYDGLEFLSNKPIYMGSVSDANIVKGYGADWQIKATSDFNNDGKTDILWQQKGTGKIELWEMNANVITQKTALYTMNNGVKTLLSTLGGWDIVGLANSRKGPDAPIDRGLIMQDRTSGELLQWQLKGGEVMLGTSGPVKTALGLDLKPGGDWNAIQIADFNNDGNSDILLQNKTTGLMAVWQLKNNLVSDIKAIGTLAPTGPWSVVSAGPMTPGNPQANLLLHNKTTGILAIDTLKDGQVLKETINIGMGDPSLGKPMKLNDFDGDNKTEVIWGSTAGKLNISRLDYDAKTAVIAPDTETNLTTLLPGWTIAAIDEFQTAPKTFNDKPNFDLVAPDIRTKANRTFTQQITKGFNPGPGEGSQTLVGYNVTIVSGADLLKAGTTPTIDNTGKLTLSTTTDNTKTGQIVLSITATDSGTDNNVSEVKTLTIDVAFTSIEKREVILRNEATGSIAMQYYEGLERVDIKSLYFGSESTANLVKGLGADYQLKAVRDFNGDGKADLMWQTSAGATTIWEMNGNIVTKGSFLYTKSGATTNNVTTLGSWDIVGFGTNRSDPNTAPTQIMMLQSRLNGELLSWQLNGKEVVLAGSGTVKTAQGAALQPGADWKVSQVADLDGDGSSDVVLQNKTTGLTALWNLKDRALNAPIQVLGTLAPAGAWSIVGTGQLTLGAPQSGLWIHNRLTGELVLDTLKDNQLLKETQSYVAAGNQPFGRPVAFGSLTGSPVTTETLWVNSTTGKISIAQLYSGDGSRIALDAETNLGTPIPGWSVAGMGDFTGAAPIGPNVI